MADKTDILVLGATGYTGGLITRYLSAHPQRAHFTLALGARSPQKLKKLVLDLVLPSSVKLVEVDVTQPAEVEAAVKATRVVINTVGPYWLWGTPVVRACVRHGVHYVDLTGEGTFIKSIVREFDYYATKTGAIIVPSCGFDSVPSDISAYLANKTLKSLGPSSNGLYQSMGESTSAITFKGGVSGGTIASVMTMLEKVPRKDRRDAAAPYSLSPFIGRRFPSFKSIYNLAVPGEKTRVGGIFVMALSNRSLVQRTFGLLEIDGLTKKTEESQIAQYGPEFCYDEFLVTSGTVSAFILTASLIVGISMLMIRPIRAVAKRILPKSGEGPSDDDMQKGFFGFTNITTSTSSPPVQVKTVVKGNGDPGYLLTAIMISESALCFLLPPVSESHKITSGSTSTSTSTSNSNSNSNVHAFPPLGRQGGVLTPMTAFGDVLIQRLEESGRFQFSSSVIDIEDVGHKDS